MEIPLNSDYLVSVTLVLYHKSQNYAIVFYSNFYVEGINT